MSAAADVFLSYSRADELAARQIQAYLKQAGLATFLDRDQLPAGQPWLSALEQAIARCAAVAVLVGPADLGTWQQREVQLALDRQAEAERAGRTFPVIPILLPKVEDPPGGFLRLQTWVDLRSDLADPTQLNLLLTGLRGKAPTDASTLREALCPYRGLLPFREEDAGLFFGREEAINTLLGKLRDHNLVTLVGRSGSGKSSVVFAGLIPALRRRADGRTWSIRSLRPGSEPLHALVRRFDPPPVDLPPFEADQRIEQQVTILRTDNQALGRRIRSLLATAEETGTDRLLLHVNQWEELYSQALRNPALEPELAERDVTKFINLVLEATRTSPCTVVLTVRADFYGEFLKHGPLAAAVPPGQVNLGPLSRQGLAAAIRKPAEAVGLIVDPPLLETLVDEVCNDLGKLPLLEYALKETWRRREGQRLTLNAYGEAGGIDGAVAQRANQIFGSLSQAQQVAARRLFVSLVSPGEGREDTRARAVYPEQDATIAAVIDKFSAADARLLVTGEDAPSARRLVDLSHEAMIREWDLLKTWIETNREALRRREHIRARLHQWEEQGRDPTLLLPPGLPLEEGRKLLADHGDVLIDEVQSYIEASAVAATAEEDATRAAQRRRLWSACLVAAAMFLLAAAVGWQWQNAKNQTRVAIKNTTDFVNKAVQLSDSFGVPRSAIGELLTLAETGFERVQEGGKLPELRSAQAWLLMARADHDEITGKSKKQQLDTAERARDILQALVDNNPPNPEWLRQLAFSHDLIGDILADPMERDAALAEYRASQEIRKKLFTDNPNDPDFERDLSISNIKIGERLSQERPDEALAAFWSTLAISERLARDYPEKLEWKRDVLEINNRIGDVLTKSDLPAALDHYQRSLEIAKQLITVAPSNIQLRYDLSTSYQKVGSNLEDQEKMHEALNAYRTSLDIANELTACDPANGTFQHATALCYENVGRVLLNQEGPQAALDHYQRLLEIRKKLADVDPSTTKLRDVFEGHNRIGELLEQGDQRQDAIAAYHASREIAQQLADSDPENADWRYLLYRQSGRVRQLEKDNEGARHMYCQAKNIAMMNSALNPADRQWKKRLDWLQQHLEDIQGSGGCPV